MTALFLLTPVFLRLTLSSELSASTSRYIRRPDDDLYVGPVLDTVVARSTLTCAAMCSRNDRCHVINVCPCDGFPRQVECSLHDEESIEVSNFVKDVALQNCFLWEKVSFFCRQKLIAKSHHQFGFLSIVRNLGILHADVQHCFLNLKLQCQNYRLTHTHTHTYL